MSAKVRRADPADIAGPCDSTDKEIGITRSARVAALSVIGTSIENYICSFTALLATMLDTERSACKQLAGALLPVKHGNCYNWLAFLDSIDPKVTP